MALTQSQYVALKNDIAADGSLSGLAHNTDNAYFVAAAYNQVSSPPITVWKTNVQVTEIFDAITWANYTPTDAVPTSDSLANDIFQSRLLVIQTKQMNLQNMLVGRIALDCSKANVRAGLRDAVIQLPSGASGALTSAGGSSAATVLAACTRLASRAEALFAGAPATTGSTTANLLIFEGALNQNDVLQAWNS